MTKANQKKIINMVNKCYNREENGTTWQRCKVYNDYCFKCLSKCERMQKIVNELNESEKESQARKKSKEVKQAEGSSL